MASEDADKSCSDSRSHQQGRGSGWPLPNRAFPQVTRLAAPEGSLLEGFHLQVHRKSKHPSGKSAQLKKHSNPRYRLRNRDGRPALGKCSDLLAPTLLTRCSVTSVSTFKVDPPLRSGFDWWNLKDKAAAIWLLVVHLLHPSDSSFSPLTVPRSVKLTASHVKVRPSIRLGFTLFACLNTLYSESVATRAADVNKLLANYELTVRDTRLQAQKSPKPTVPIGAAIGFSEDQPCSFYRCLETIQVEHPMIHDVVDVFHLGISRKSKYFYDL